MISELAASATSIESAIRCNDPAGGRQESGVPTRSGEYRPSLYWSGLKAAICLLPLVFAAFFTSAALAQTHGGAALAPPALEPRKIFVMLFLMLGPIKILMPFVGMTAATDTHLRHVLATRAILFSAAAIAFAGFFGQILMANFNVSLPVLTLAGGVVLFLVALQTVLQQSASPNPVMRQSSVEPGLHLALAPLAFPIIVTPYGIAAVIVFATIADGDAGAQFTIAVIVLAILAMDWLAMVFADAILRWMGTTLQVFAVVLGIAQVALGLQIIFHSLSLIGVVVEHAR